MDDLFGMLYGDLDPKRKLLTVVTSNMVDSLRVLLQGNRDLDLDCKLLQQNGNKALHIAAQSGHQECMRQLLAAGANADVENDFGFTPLQVALRQGKAQCVQLIFEGGTRRTDPLLIWQAQQIHGIPSWIGYDQQLLKLLFIATPDLRALSDEVKGDLFERKLRGGEYVDLVKTYFLTGGDLTPERNALLLASVDDVMKAWIKSQQTAQPLQHYTRLSIRRSLKPNAFYAVPLLPLPEKLKDYLIYEED